MIIDTAVIAMNICIAIAVAINIAITMAATSTHYNSYRQIASYIQRRAQVMNWYITTINGLLHAATSILQIGHVIIITSYIIYR